MNNLNYKVDIHEVHKGEDIGCLTHLHLKGHMKIVVMIYGSFDNNFGIKKRFYKIFGRELLVKV